jgi:hypothetical protein
VVEGHERCKKDTGQIKGSMIFFMHLLVHAISPRSLHFGGSGESAPFTVCKNNNNTTDVMLEQD